MSMNFNVYPGSDKVPALQEVLDLANAYVNDYLRKMGIQKEYHLSFGLSKTWTHEPLSFDIDNKMLWEWGEEYLWLYYEGIDGGTDGHFHKYYSITYEVWESELQTGGYREDINNIIKTSMQLGYHWSFRRAACNPGLVVLAYGMVAAAMAKLCDGFIYSDDGAWDFEIFPALPDEFLEVYFHPEKAQREDVRKYALQCIQSIKEMGR